MDIIRRVDRWTVLRYVLRTDIKMPCPILGGQSSCLPLVRLICLIPSFHAVLYMYRHSTFYIFDSLPGSSSFSFFPSSFPSSPTSSRPSPPPPPLLLLSSFSLSSVFLDWAREKESNDWKGRNVIPLTFSSTFSFSWVFTLAMKYCCLNLDCDAELQLPGQGFHCIACHAPLCSIPDGAFTNEASSQAQGDPSCNQPRYGGFASTITTAGYVTSSPSHGTPLAPNQKAHQVAQSIGESALEHESRIVGNVQRPEDPVTYTRR